MKFVRHHNNGLTAFKLIKHSREINSGLPGERWITVGESQNLRSLLGHHEMLNFTEAEVLAAQMLVKKNNEWHKSQSSRDYCRKQAALIAEYADDAIERVASQIIEPSKFVDMEYGLPSWTRRLTLAFVSELGISI